MLASQRLETRHPSHILIGFSGEALADARTALRDVSITAEQTPAHEQLFYSIGQHFLTLGGNLRLSTERLAHLAGVELPQIDEMTGRPLNPEEIPQAGLPASLVSLRDLSIDVGRDSLFLEIEPVDNSDPLTMQDRAEIIIAKFKALDDFGAALPKVLTMARAELAEHYAAFEADATELEKAINPKITLLDRYQAMRHTTLGRHLNWAIWFNTIVGVGSVAALQIAERQNPGFGEFIRQTPGFGWMYEQVLVPPYYKAGSALLAMLNSPVPQRLLLSRDRKKDVIKFTISDKPISLPPDYIENLAPETR